MPALQKVMLHLSRISVSLAVSAHSEKFLFAPLLRYDGHTLVLPLPFMTSLSDSSNMCAEPTPLTLRPMLVDGTGLIFRAYFAVGARYDQQQRPCGAWTGFFMMLMKLLDTLSPTHLWIAFDAGKRTFRHKLSNRYKAHRPALPDELKPQFALIQAWCTTLGWAHGHCDGFEADDLLCTLGAQHEARYPHIPLTVVSSDKDMLQMVREQVHVYNPLSQMMMRPETVRELTGVYPAQWCDYQALVGDVSDGIPGFPGVGAKTAAKWLQAHGTLAGVAQNTDSLPLRFQEKWGAHQTTLALSRQLVELCTTSSVDLAWDAWVLPAFTAAGAERLQQEGFSDLAQRWTKQTMSSQNKDGLALQKKLRPRKTFVHRTGPKSHTPSPPVVSTC